MRALLVFVALLSTAAVNADVHKVVLHISDADPARHNLVLNNAKNLNNYYLDKGEEAQVEIVAYGPGLTMLVPGKSTVGERVSSMTQSYDNLTFRACANTLRKMSKKAGKDVQLMSQARMVPSGVIHLIERQEQGWAYIRP